MPPRTLPAFKSSAGAMLVCLCAAIAFAPGPFGCVQASADKPLVQIDLGGEPEPIDASSVPPTSSHEEARQRLAEAYAHIRALQRQVQRLENKIDDLKKDLKEVKKERDHYEDLYKDCRKRYERLRKSLERD